MEVISTILHQSCLALFVILLMLAGRADLKTFKIPNQIPVAIALLMPAYGLSADGPFPWILSLAVAGGVFLTGLGFFSLRLMGGGDVKLMSAVSLWAGPLYALDFLLVTMLMGGLLSGIALLKKRYGFVRVWENGPSQNVVPYGVAIAFGGLGLAALLIQGKAL